MNKFWFLIIVVFFVTFGVIVNNKYLPLSDEAVIPVQDTFHSAILITLDTLRGDHLGFTGNPDTRSPALDRLSKRSKVYPEAFSNLPITLPAHSAMMTSRYPRETNVMLNSHLLHADFVTIAEIMKTKNFATAAHPQAVLQFPRGLERGFDVFKGRAIKKLKSQTLRNESRLRFNYPTESKFTGVNPVPEALQWIAAKESIDERYFLWLHFFEPHLPYNPPEPYRFIDQQMPDDRVTESIQDFPSRNRVTDSNFSSDEIAIAKTMYRNEIFWVDRKLESLFQYAETLEKRKPFIVVTADHGETLHDRFTYFGHGFNINLEELHIPFLLYSGGTDSSLDMFHVQSVDIAPTILGALGIAGLPSFKGIDIRHNQDVGDRNIPFSLGSPLRFCGAINSRYKVVHDLLENAWFYWNREDDPNEKRPSILDDRAPEAVLSLQQTAIAYAAINPEVETLNGDVEPELMDMLEQLGYIQ